MSKKYYGKTSPFYINHKELRKEIVESKANNNIPTKRLEEMLILLTKRVISKMNYYNPDDKNDCFQTAFYTLWKNWSSYDEIKYPDSSFSYLTEIVKRGMAKGWNDLHNNKSWVSKNMVHGGFIMFQGEMSDTD